MSESLPGVSWVFDLQNTTPVDRMELTHETDLLGDDPPGLINFFYTRTLQGVSNGLPHTTYRLPLGTPWRVLV